MCSQGQSQHSYTEELSTFCSVQDLQTFTLYFYFLPLQLSSLTSAPLLTAEQRRDFWINPISTRPRKCKGVQVSSSPKGWVDLPWQLLRSIAKIQLVLCLGGSSMASTLSVSTADINRLFCVSLGCVSAYGCSCHSRLMGTARHPVITGLRLGAARLSSLTVRGNGGYGSDECWRSFWSQTTSSLNARRDLLLLPHCRS